MDINIDEIEAAAKGATQGPWRLHVQPAERYTPTLTGASHYNADYWAVVSVPIEQKNDKYGAGPGVICDNGHYYAAPVSEQDARFMAVANPEIVLGMIEIIRKLRAGEQV